MLVFIIGYVGVLFVLGVIYLVLSIIWGIICEIFF